MSVDSSLSIKESIRLEAALGGVREALVSRLTATRACRLVAKYVILEMALLEEIRNLKAYSYTI